MEYQTGNRSITCNVENQYHGSGLRGKGPDLEKTISKAKQTASETGKSAYVHATSRGHHISGSKPPEGQDHFEAHPHGAVSKHEWVPGLHGDLSGYRTTPVEGHGGGHSGARPRYGVKSEGGMHHTYDSQTGRKYQHFPTKGMAQESADRMNSARGEK